jgi:hypothetical protein
MAPRDYAFTDINLHPAERKPDGTTTSKSTKPQAEFTTVDLGDDGESLHVRTLSQREDDEFVRDCPDDVSYEENRQRYMAASFMPANQMEGAAYMLLNAPACAKTGAQITARAASSMATSASECYAEKGVTGVAKSVVTSGLSVAGGVAASLSGAGSSMLGSWYGTRSSETQKLERQSSGGQRYTLPGKDDIQRGVKDIPARDLAVVEDLGGEEWDLDDDVEEVHMNAKLRRYKSS